MIDPVFEALGLQIPQASSRGAQSSHLLDSSLLQSGAWDDVFGVGACPPEGFPFAWPPLSAAPLEVSTMMALQSEGATTPWALGAYMNYPVASLPNLADPRSIATSEPGSPIFLPQPSLAAGLLGTRPAIGQLQPSSVDPAIHELDEAVSRLLQSSEDDFQAGPLISDEVPKTPPHGSRLTSQGCSLLIGTPAKVLVSDSSAKPEPPPGLKATSHSGSPSSPVALKLSDMAFYGFYDNVFSDFNPLLVPVDGSRTTLPSTIPTSDVEPQEVSWQFTGTKRRTRRSNRAGYSRSSQAEAR